MSVLVLGGYGAVGGHLVRLLRARGVPVLAAGRDAARADRVLDVALVDSVVSALDGVSIVVNCAGVEDIGLAEACACRGIAFLEISATSGYVQALERVEGPVVLGVGLAPGLTTLLAVDVLSRDPGPVDIMVGLGSGEHHGAAATAWNDRLMGQHFPDPDGTSVRNFTEPAQFTIPEYTGIPAVSRAARRLRRPAPTHPRIRSTSPQLPETGLPPRHRRAGSTHLGTRTTGGGSASNARRRQMGCARASLRWVLTLGQRPWTIAGHCRGRRHHSPGDGAPPHNRADMDSRTSRDRAASA
ncbi:NAD-dependent epimerase/dehydratase family protein [Nocardia canadensis]|uniref:NAD-dependent epimerase/dehydratase family protein n=1 Tax=Nocardia canadensis TaxID=3065238 RepID=UPI00292F077C|nr:NAD-dependent epimerase/dehydratase family protein [Nocardia canadensis]